MLVRDRMTTQPITVEPQCSVAQALKIMEGRKIRRLPVVQKGQVVGIITLLDLMRVSASPATTLSVYELHYLLDRLTVQEAMTRRVITVSPDTPIEEAALLMRTHKIGGIPVVEAGALVGIITETDVFDAFVDLLGVRSGGVRVTVECQDRPGELAHVSQHFADAGVNIQSVVTFHPRAGSAQLVFRVAGDSVEAALERIRSDGYAVSINGEQRAA